MSAPDFDVLVEREANELRVRVLRSPGGETGTLTSALPADLAVAMPPGAPTLLAATRDIGGDEPVLDRRAVGRQLFEALLPGEARTRFRESLRVAGGALRVVIRTGASADAIPWELLFDPEPQLFLATDPRTPVVRCVEVASAPPPPPSAGGPWPLLVVTAAPSDLPPLDIEREVTQLTAALAPLADAGAITIELARDCSPAELDARVATLAPRVVHFIGHGSRLGGAAGSIQLVGADGRAVAYSGADVARSLAPGGTRLVVLNSCHGAVNDAASSFAGPAAALVRAGVPAVIAMTGAVHDDQAIAWSQELYTRLVAGADVDDAVTAARRTLVVTHGEDGDWPLAALYLGSSSDPAITTNPLAPLDDDVGFTVSRPAALRAARWETLLVHAHRTTLQQGPAGETIDPAAIVRREVADVFGPDAAGVASTTDEAGAPIPIGSELRVVADVPGIECHPPSDALAWTGEVVAVRFQLRAPADRVGQRVDGFVRVYAGILLVAETALGFDVVGDDPVAPQPDLASGPLVHYRRIFPCFSPDDGDLVSTLAAGAELVGSRYTAGAIDHVLDGAPPDSLLSMVADADLFQLFWSSSSMRSPACRAQWEAALGMQRPRFVQAVYWERPFPKTDGAPSVELATAATFTPVTLPRHLAPARPAPAPDPGPSELLPAPPPGPGGERGGAEAVPPAPAPPPPASSLPTAESAPPPPAPAPSPPTAESAPPPAPVPPPSVAPPSGERAPAPSPPIDVGVSVGDHEYALPGPPPRRRRIGFVLAVAGLVVLAVVLIALT